MKKVVTLNVVTKFCKHGPKYLEKFKPEPEPGPTRPEKPDPT